MNRFCLAFQFTARLLICVVTGGVFVGFGLQTVISLVLIRLYDAKTVLRSIQVDVDSITVYTVVSHHK